MTIVQLHDYIGQIVKTIPIVYSYSNQTPYEYWNTQEIKYGSVIFCVKNVRTQNNIAKYGKNLITIWEKEWRFR